MKTDFFSKRTADWRLDPNPLSKKVFEFRGRGEPFLDLTGTNPTRSGFNYADVRLSQAFGKSENLIYDPAPRGLPAAREAVCRYYAGKGVRVSPSQVLITATTSEAYAYVMRLLASSGESLLVPRPSYPLLDYLMGLNDLHALPYRLDPDRNWAMDMEGLVRQLSASPRALIAVHPNNPTGNYVRGEERERLNEIARRHGLALIVDEVFHDYPLEPGAGVPESFAANEPVLTFTLSGISKILGLPQMKLSWIVVSGPPELTEPALGRLEVIADTFLSAATPVQNALPVWLEKRDRLAGQIRERIRRNFHVLKGFAGQRPELRPCFPEGGWAAPLRLPAEKNDEAWALHFLEKSKVLVHPGYLFDFQEGSFAVLSLLTPPDTFEEGLRRLFGR